MRPEAFDHTEAEPRRSHNTDHSEKKRRKHEHASFGERLENCAVTAKAHSSTSLIADLRRRVQPLPSSPSQRAETSKAYAPLGEASPPRSHDFRQHDGDDTHRPRPPQNLKARAQALYSQRKSLPIWSHADSIRQQLREQDILILVGETGSGKSTQIPQILIEEPFIRRQLESLPPRHSGLKSHPFQDKYIGRSRGSCIAITQPRRIAAISLARRVAEEMGTPLGTSSPASKVGYSVRFDNATGPSTQIKFLTEGMLLQEMLRDPYLRQYCAIVVDEVHERGINVDLVLGFLKRMVVDGHGKKERKGTPLKVVVMSATAEFERLKTFFGQQIPSKLASTGATTSHEQENGINAREESESEWPGLSSSDEESQDWEQATRITAANGRSMPASASHVTSSPLAKSVVTTCHIKGRQHPVSVHYLTTPVQDFLSAALTSIFQLHHSEPVPGDLLVFLTGQEAVESLEKMVKEYATGLNRDVPQLLVLPLFAALPQAAQQRVFLPALKRTRKVILSTNIAETSLTVPGIRYVIDGGKAKVKLYRTKIGLESLLVKPISRSAAIQRKGRAGREAPGKCFRLYTEEGYLGMQENNTPEILRCDLSHALLTMKARGVEDVAEFPLLDRPQDDAVEKALLLLHQLDGVDDTGAITPVGLQMARLPLPVTLGRTLIAASPPANSTSDETDSCLEEVIDIVSCLAVEESPFLALTSEDAREAAETARRRSQLYRREGDHLTLLATIRQYCSDQGSGGDRRRWCEEHFVSHRAMRAAIDVRKQLRSLYKLTPSEGLASLSGSADVHSKTEAILKAFLVGFATNTARLCADGSYKTLVGNQTVKIHPSSVLFSAGPLSGDANGDDDNEVTQRDAMSRSGRKVECIMYNEFVYTNRTYARGVSAVQMDWVGDIFARRGQEGQRNY